MNTWVIARSTFGELIRKRIGLYVLFSAIVFIILSQLFASLSMQSSITAGSTRSGSVEVTVIKSMAFGIIVIGGLILSTVLTLVIVPAGFSLADSFERWLGPKVGRLLTTGGAKGQRPTAVQPAE
jgi:hypothetical protein